MRSWFWATHKSMWVVLALSFLQCALADGWASIEAAHSVPKGWMQLDRHVPESQQIELHLYLKQRNVAELYQRFESISDPLSADYGRFLTQHELTALISPSTETLQLVEDWLREANVDVELNSNLDIALCRTDVAGANRLVSGATWSYFQNEAGHTVVRSATPYLIPSRLVGHIDAIAGLRTFPPARPRSLAPRGTTSTGGISPAEIKKYFNMPANIAGTASSNLQAVAEFLEQYYAPSDLTTFQQNFKLPKQAVTKVDGPNVASNPGIEASLDIEYIMGVAPGVPTWFVYTPKLHDGQVRGSFFSIFLGLAFEIQIYLPMVAVASWRTCVRSKIQIYLDSPSCPPYKTPSCQFTSLQEPFAIWIYNIGNLTDPPLVHSVSYGDVEDSVLMEWAQRVDTEFVKLQSKGLSLVLNSYSSLSVVSGTLILFSRLTSPSKEI